MTKDDLLSRLQDIEWDDFEVKEAKSELPKSIWETVSAFCNTSGGWIVLGVAQQGSHFEVTGVGNSRKIGTRFLWSSTFSKVQCHIDITSLQIYN